jgi:hypothetical protein
MTVATAIALAIASVALVLAVVALVQISPMRRKLAPVREDGDVMGLVQGLDRDLASVETQLVDLYPRIEKIERFLPYAISRVGVVNYDAFGNITGNQSRSMAFLDSRGSGVVISVLVGRSEMLFYTKQIKGGRGTEQLSPEEQSAIDKAMGR